MAGLVKKSDCRRYGSQRFAAPGAAVVAAFAVGFALASTVHGAINFVVRGGVEKGHARDTVFLAARRAVAAPPDDGGKDRQFTATAGVPTVAECLANAEDCLVLIDECMMGGCSQAIGNLRDDILHQVGRGTSRGMDAILDHLNLALVLEDTRPEGRSASLNELINVAEVWLGHKPEQSETSFLTLAFARLDNDGDSVIDLDNIKASDLFAKSEDLAKDLEETGLTRGHISGFKLAEVADPIRTSRGALTEAAVRRGKTDEQSWSKFEKSCGFEPVSKGEFYAWFLKPLQAFHA
eukprot:TRINITY_DN121058_c0_g1_i1.p1 TRINITY_DN121058_c0_g1~~TRINITY_DN121058_c0_g1_i1.p1  ORF type:complete len:294 (+),score=80.15 TRINITY_DN121058_c0_g1_i1:93-974(+)